MNPTVAELRHDNFKRTPTQTSRALRTSSGTQSRIATAFKDHRQFLLLDSSLELFDKAVKSISRCSFHCVLFHSPAALIKRWRNFSEYPERWSAAAIIAFSTS